MNKAENFYKYWLDKGDEKSNTDYYVMCLVLTHLKNL